MKKENWDKWEERNIKPIEVRKVVYDGLWHVVYEYEKLGFPGKKYQTYDRVTKDIAMKVAGKYLS